MKKIVTFVAIIIAVMSFSSCTESISDYEIRWGISETHIENFNTYGEEMSTLYDTFDQAFEKASFGSMEEHHRIVARALKPRQVEKVKKEAVELADEANQNLKDFAPVSSYTVSVYCFDPENGDITLASYHYGPQE